jgi:hypothetical protein
VLRAGDIPGFIPQGYTAPSTSAHNWVAEFPAQQRASEEARLKALGFTAAISEHLAPAQGAGGSREAISVVEQFSSARGASGEVAGQVKQAPTHGQSAFAVAGIPGAHGFGSSIDSNVAFAVGSFYYLVGFSSNTSSPTRSQLITAAQRLYSRVR